MVSSEVTPFQTPHPVEKALNLRGSEENLLYKADQALYRIEKGTYGLCIQCQRKIDKKRLDAIPYAELCIKCQASQEKKT